MKYLLKLNIILSIIIVNINLLPLPYNQYAYMLAREQIKEHDKAIQAQNNLNSKEKVVNLYFEYLRAKDFLKTKPNFYPSRPIESELENIINSQFYKFLLKLPKGGNLHIHEFQVLNRKILLESIKNSPEYDLLYICDQNNCITNKHHLNYFMKNVPSGWTKVKDSNWTIDDIVKKTTFIGILNELKIPLYSTDTEARWDLANQYGVFSFYRDIVRYNATRFNYLKLVLDEALNENIQLLEFRRGLFGNTFYFDNNGSKIYVNPMDELHLLNEFKKDYIKKNPLLIDFIFIIYSSRILSKDKINNQINNLIHLHQFYPDLIRGYDMVGEEDQGHTLLFHSQNLIQIFNYSSLNKNSFNLFFHAGETNWPEEHLPNHGDGVSTFENIYDAILLRTRRIGHGLSLAKRPDMYEYIKQRNIAIEVCPASNQILGYVADLRNHPGIVYHRSGIPVVLSGDDPGSFGYNQLTVDFYLSTMAWGLNLADLKQFASNSIEHSSIPDSMKHEAFQKWLNQWNLFIDSSYESACHLTYPNRIMNISDILPQYGPYDKSINVTLFGSGFQIAICKSIICKFGQKQTNGIFVNLNEIICPTPLQNQDFSNVSLSLLIDNKLIQSELYFQFVTSLLVIDDGTFTTIISSKSNQVFIFNHLFMLVLFIRTFILILEIING